MSRLAAARRRLVEDLDAVVERDPSVHSRGEAALTPGLRALWLHRLAHRLHGRGHRVAARAVAEVARLLSGIEIHPGARIGRKVLIDHGYGTVIGETAVVGDGVTIYHNVTLGALGWWRDPSAEQRRHPVVEPDAVIGTGASVLGAVTVWRGAVVGAHATVLRDVPPGGRVSGRGAAEARRPAAGVVRFPLPGQEVAGR